MVIYLMTANVFIDDGMTLIRPLRKNKFYLHKMGIKIKDPKNEILSCQYACAYKPLKHGNPIINGCLYFAK